MENSINEWLLTRSDRLPTAQSFALWVLGAILCLIVWFHRDGSAASDFISVALITIIIYLLCFLRDLDVNRRDRDFSQVMVLQRVFKKLGLDYYLPREAILHGDLPAPDNEQLFRYRTEKGTYEKYIALPNARSMGFLKMVLGIIAGLILVYLVLAKHSFQLFP